ncbi:uncharacterized protein LOC134194669 [Corticium candelabrum]|uniref:uncharacterized protein LOC134194669 n=1 Tax=Corticium candelabrum TaxID=121492 RepID=UPI002E26F7AC|nr:uncharacterized protein LOC134194669 [Corticium candelabrum]
MHTVYTGVVWTCVRMNRNACSKKGDLCVVAIVLHITYYFGVGQMCNSRCGTGIYHAAGSCQSSGRCLCWWGFTGPNAVYIVNGKLHHRILADHCTVACTYNHVYYNKQCASLPGTSTAAPDYNSSATDYNSRVTVYDSSTTDYHSSTTYYHSSSTHYHSSTTHYHSSTTDYDSSATDYDSSATYYDSSATDYNSSTTDYHSSTGVTHWHSST